MRRKIYTNFHTIACKKKKRIIDRGRLLMNRLNISNEYVDHTFVQRKPSERLICGNTEILKLKEY